MIISNEMTNIRDFLHGLAKNATHYFSLKGTWSPAIFMRDMKEYEIISIEKVISELNRENKLDYLEFFKVTRGYERPLSNWVKNVWKVFDQGSIMLYFEKSFIRLISLESPSERDKILLSWFNTLGKAKYYTWDEIVSKYGAGTVNLFVSNPEAYTEPDALSDFSLVNSIGYTFSYNTNVAKRTIGFDMTRENIIEKRDEYKG